MIMMEVKIILILKFNFLEYSAILLKIKYGKIEIIYNINKLRLILYYNNLNLTFI